MVGGSYKNFKLYSLLTTFKAPFFLLLFSLLATPLLAQKKNWQDVVYLKNGSILRGELAADPAGGTVKIETAGRNLFVFQAAEVEKVSRELIRPAYKYPFNKGYLNMTEAGLSVGNSSSWNQRRQKDITLQTFNGYQFASYLALGVTAGVDAYSGITLLPLGMGLRGDLTKTRNRPYYSFDAGYGLDWLHNPRLSGNRQGGFFWSPGAGMKFSGKENHAFLISLAYRQQASTLEMPFSNGTSVTENKFKRVLFRVGMSF
jgi:hypothetical protein